MNIRQMTLEELRLVLDWAAQEGWNPGVEDAEAFYAADPGGFWVNEVDGQPVAAISVVKHNSAFAFLGLYICKPEYRGQGLGRKVWDAAMAHAGDRCIGLDGVPAQQKNYEISGFKKAFENVRYTGSIKPEHSPHIRAVGHEDLKKIIELDAVLSGVERPLFAKEWFAEMETRKTLVLKNDLGKCGGFATVRECLQGAKLGPFYAEDEAGSIALLAACAATIECQQLIIDVPETSAPLAKLLVTQGFEPSFNTARMYTKSPPRACYADFYANATLELG